MHASFTVDNYGKATVVFDGYTERPSTKDNAHQRRCPQVTNKVDISIVVISICWKKGLPCKQHEQTGTHETYCQLHATERLPRNSCRRRCRCRYSKAAITASSYSSTTLIGKDMELLGLLLYYYEELDSNDLYFWSDKDRITPYVYNIRILKQLLGHEFCNLLFGHAFLAQTQHH